MAKQEGFLSLSAQNKKPRRSISPLLIMEGIIRREKISIIRRENESRRPSAVVSDLKTFPLSFLLLQIIPLVFLLFSHIHTKHKRTLSLSSSHNSLSLSISIYLSMAESVELPHRLAILPFRNKVLLPGAIIRIRCTSPSRCTYASMLNYDISLIYY